MEAVAVLVLERVLELLGVSEGVTPWEPVLEAEGVPLGVVVDDGVGSSYV